MMSRLHAQGIDAKIQNCSFQRPNVRVGKLGLRAATCWLYPDIYRLNACVENADRMVYLRTRSNLACIIFVSGQHDTVVVSGQTHGANRQQKQSAKYKEQG
jgi:hypothetical protein